LKECEDLDLIKKIVDNYELVFIKILEFVHLENQDQPLVSKTERVKGGFRSLKEGLSDTGHAAT